MNKLLAKYQSHLKGQQAELEKIKKKDQVVGWSRLVVAILLLFVIYGILTREPITYGIVFVLSSIGFMILLNVHQNIREKRQDIQALVDVLIRETDYLNGDLEQLPAGKEFIDHEHIYTSDLNVFGEFSLFRHINRSSTYVGKQKLAHHMTSDLDDDIALRQEAIAEMASKYDFRMAFMKHGQKEDHAEDIEAIAQRWIDRDYKRNIVFNKFVYGALALLSIGSFIYFLINLSFGTFYIFLFFSSFNMWLANREMKKIEPYLALLRGTDKAINTYSNLIKEIESEHFDSHMLGKFKSALATKTGTLASVKLKSFQKYLRTYETKENDIGSALFNSFLMFYIHVFNQIESWKSDNKDLLLDWLDIVSSLDKYVSLGTYAYHHPDFSYPNISDKIAFRASDVKHPLMPADQCVGNDLILDKKDFVILTGSNMSGKSTFLRTIGLNMLLFKIGCPTHAKSFESFPFTIATSMNVADELSANTSFFLAEIKRLQAIQDTIEKSEFTFLLLDEILRGTNSDDKRNGTLKFLKKLSDEKVMGLIATHDIEVAELEGEDDLHFTSYYFESQLIENELEFDYKLRKGVCHSPNATLLLEIKGIIPKDS